MRYSDLSELLHRKPVFLGILCLLTALIFVPDLCGINLDLSDQSSILAMQDLRVQMVAVGSASSTVYIFFEILVDVVSFKLTNRFFERVILFIALNSLNALILTSNTVHHHPSVLVSVIASQSVLMVGCFLSLLNDFDAKAFPMRICYVCMIISFFAFVAFKLSAVFNSQVLQDIEIAMGGIVALIFVCISTYTTAVRIAVSYKKHSGSITKVFRDPSIGIWGQLYFLIPAAALLFILVYLNRLLDTVLRTGQATPEYLLTYVFLWSFVILWLMGFPGLTLFEKNLLKDQLEINRYLVYDEPLAPP